MKFCFLPILFFSSALFAQDTTPSQTAAATASTMNRSIIMIDPKGRANDYSQAFDFLRKDKPTQKIMVRMMNGMILSNVSEITATQSGTLLMIKFLSNSGNKTQIVPIEDIMELNYSP